MPLVDAVFMRLNPVLPGPMWRRTDHPLLGCGFTVPVYRVVGVMQSSVFQHPDLFHRAREIFPVRWLEELGEGGRIPTFRGHAGARGLRDKLLWWR